MDAIDHGLVPDRVRLGELRAARTACADALWADHLAAPLATAFPAIATATEGADAVVRREVRTVASAAYGLAAAIYDLHGDDLDRRDRAARPAMWMTLAAAAVDHLVDDGVVDADDVRRHLNPTAVLAAIEPTATVEPGIPTQPYLDLLLAPALRGIRACVATAATSFELDVVHELRVCLREMIEGQLASPRLRLGPHVELDDIETTLHRVNALTVWIATYLGFLGGPRPPAATVLAVRQVTTRIGELGWILDALSDLHADLAAGVWSLGWLELARATGTTHPWLRHYPERPRLALELLREHGITDGLLARARLAIDEIARTPGLRPGAAEALADFCRYMAWSFLATVRPRP